jgi:hypothetical protein
MLRLTGPDASSASSWALEQADMPSLEAVVNAACELMQQDPSDR